MTPVGLPQRMTAHAGSSMTGDALSHPDAQPAARKLGATPDLRSTSTHPADETGSRRAVASLDPHRSPNPPGPWHRHRSP